MKLKIILLIGIFLANTLFLAGCSAVNSLIETPSTQKQGVVKFSFQEKQLTKLAKLTAASTSANIASVVLTIKDAQNNTIKDKLKLNLYKFDTVYISDNLTLPIGDFTVTEFFVTDQDNNIIYVTPLKDSENAKYVTTPLPYSIKVEKDITKSLPIEVLDITDKNPEQFGYTSFILTIVGKDDPTTSGNITVDTTWKKSQSPILIQSDVCVQNGATLTIEPGVEVRFLGAYALKIYGTLIAKGTDTEKIAFTANNKIPGAWKGIYFGPKGHTFDANGNYVLGSINGEYYSGSILKNCIIEYAGATPSTYDESSQLDNDIFYTDSAITCFGSAPYIFGNTIRYNGKGISIIGVSPSNLAIVKNNIIENNVNEGIFLFKSTYKIANNNIINNYIGIKDRTTINNSGESPMYEISYEITYNNIKNNQTFGIFRDYDASNSGTHLGVNINHNNIFGNNGVYQYSIALRNITSDNLANNYWGTSDSNIVSRIIYRNSQNPIYLPIETSEIANAGPQ
ncbi:MAG: right-handed parallel beta-helix repeat-containing protein [Candidatus Margulisiibacteriota bacterium]|jgi:hypothetical protein